MFVSASKQTSLKFLLPLIIISLFCSPSESSQSETDCLRSIKDSLQDPLNKLSTWRIDDQDEINDDSFICSFNGVDCWGSPFGNKIQKISLSGMELRGEFPRGIVHCSSLISLDFSRNNLYGPIPSDIWSNLGNLFFLDLSFNAFSGEIPDNLNLLHLNFFSVANNDLSGLVPQFTYSKFSKESYVNNEGLCGEPLEPCSSDRTIGVLGCYLGGWVVFFLLFFRVGLYIPVEKFVHKYTEPREWTAPRTALLLSTQRVDNSEISMLGNFVPRMSLHELTEATNGFSQQYIITNGEFGTIYKGFLTNGSCIAIKRLHLSIRQEHEFLSEITTLGRIRHNNLVPLIGFCCESNERMLIHKFIPSGTLYGFLSKNGNSMISEWPIKHKVAVGVAKGIAWLHLNGVVHRAVTSKSVPLDQYFEPKISNFGRATPITPSGQEQHLRDREFPVPECCYVEDVHGFGVVLLELITGKKLNDPMERFEIIDRNNLVELTSYLLTNAEAIGLENEEKTSRFLKIARTCLEREARNAPQMLEVCKMLIGTESLSIDGSDHFKGGIEFIE